jgi:tricarballylate dehydrogenase
MPPVFPGVKADTLPNWRASWADGRRIRADHDAYNAACRRAVRPHRAGRLPHRGPAAPQDALGAPARHAPFYGYALRPGVTFTYLGLKVNDRAGAFSGSPATTCSWPAK